MYVADEVLLAVGSCWAIVRQHVKQGIAAMLFFRDTQLAVMPRKQSFSAPLAT